MKVAAIDIGTNSIHMVVVRIDRTPSFEVVDREKEMIKLGRERLKDGKLTKGAMDLGISVLTRMKKLSVAHGCQYLIAAATSAVRDAKNRQEFLRRVEEEVGIRVRVLSGEEEAELIFRAVRDGTDLTDKKALVIDLGGGSTEFIVGNNFGAHMRESLQLGVIRMTDEFSDDERELSAKRYKLLAKEVRRLAGGSVERARAIGFDEVIGTSGTFKAIGDLLRAPDSIPVGEATHVAPLHFEEIDELTRRLQHLDVRARAQLNGMNPMRADNIAVGATIVRELMLMAGVDRIQVSNRALRDGLVLEIVRQVPELDRALREGPDLRRRSILTLARIHAPSVPHGAHVARLALQIFDQTGGLHHLDRHDRELLEHAAQVHDVGLVIGYTRHHHHSFYVISNAELLGFDAQEVLELALICRYHRKSFPSSGDSGMNELPRNRTEVVAVLGGILRLADGLDRSHESRISRVQVLHSSDRLELELEAASDCELELAAAARKKDALERIWKKPISFRLRRGEVADQSKLDVNQLSP